MSSEAQPKSDPYFSRDCTEALLASALVSNAVSGLHSDHKNDRKSLLFYFFYRQRLLTFLLYIVLVALHGISAWDTLDSKASPDFLSVLTIEIVCLSYLGGRLFIRGLITPSNKFWYDVKNVIQVVTLVATFVDIIVFIIAPTGWTHRWSTVLRPLFIINSEEFREVRRAIRNIRDTLPEVLNVLILFFLSLATFSVIGLVLLQKQQIVIRSGPTSGKSYFTNFGDILFDLYVLVTTANNPDLMMPAYNRNRWYALFFVIFLIVNLYLFMNIILAVIYNNYRKHLKVEVENLLALKRDSLSKAYDVLVGCNNQIVKPDETPIDGVTYGQFQDLVDNFYDARKIIRKNQHHALLADVFWKLLTTEERLKKKEFTYLAELLSMKITIKFAERNLSNAFEKIFPALYFSVPSRAFHSCVKSKYFRYIFDVLIVVNVVTVAFTLEERLKYFEWFLLSAFSFEILAKIYTFGVVSFSQKFWNIFDFLVIGAAVSFWVLMELKLFPDIQQYLDLMLVLRILRLCKLIGAIDRFRVVVKTIEALLPSILTYGILLFVLFYVYAVIGLQTFGGLMKGNDGRSCRNDTVHCCPQYASPQVQYCTVNFNSFSNSLLFLFNLMVVNQWHVLASGVEAMTGSKWTRLFFVSFHLLCVIIVLNIFTAFVLEAFILEYNSLITTTNNKSNLAKFLAKQPSEVKSSADVNTSVQYGVFIDADHEYDTTEDVTPEEMIKRDRRFSIVHTTESHTIKVELRERKSVDILLARMFENELSDETPRP